MSYKQDSEMSPWDKGLGSLGQRNTYSSFRPLSSAFSPKLCLSGPHLSPCLFLNFCFMGHLRWFFKFRCSSSWLSKGFKALDFTHSCWPIFATVSTGNAPSHQAFSCFCATPGQGVGISFRELPSDPQGEAEALMVCPISWNYTLVFLRCTFKLLIAGY